MVFLKFAEPVTECSFQLKLEFLCMFRMMSLTTICWEMESDETRQTAHHHRLYTD